MTTVAILSGATLLTFNLGALIALHAAYRPGKPAARSNKARESVAPPRRCERK